MILSLFWIIIILVIYLSIGKEWLNICFNTWKVLSLNWNWFNTSYKMLATFGVFSSSKNLKNASCSQMCRFWYKSFTDSQKIISWFRITIRVHSMIALFHFGISIHALIRRKTSSKYFYLHMYTYRQFWKNRDWELLYRRLFFPSKAVWLEAMK